MAKRKQTPRCGGKGHGKSCGDSRQGDSKGDSGTGDDSRGLAKGSTQLGLEVYLLLGISKGHIGISWAPLHYRKSTTTRNLLNY